MNAWAGISGNNVDVVLSDPRILHANFRRVVGLLVDEAVGGYGALAPHRESDGRRTQIQWPL
jgi:hypothetical protein